MSYQSLFEILNKDPIWEKWLETLPTQLDALLDPAKNGNLPRWFKAIEKLPNVTPSHHSLNTPYITVGDTTETKHESLKTQLAELKPWRKGPFQLFDVTINTEWRSDWKWDRLNGCISPLQGKTVLDVGCGNGYHSWRMAGCGAKLVIGIDPSLLFVMQYKAVKKYLTNTPVFVLPLRLEDMPENLPAFDTVFSMGVLYHRRAPFDHLYELKNLLKPGGELVLETLIVEGDENTVLVPKERYAQMNNVWCLPSTDAMMIWLEKCGFNDIKLINVNQTTLEEQRQTEWMEYNSLESYLAPNDHNLTIEGYPAPTRAIFIATKPT